MTNARPGGPKDKVWIADDKALQIAQIGEMSIPTRGYEIMPQEGVAPRDWPERPCHIEIPSSRTLVVDGLGDDMMLLSVRGLLRDGVKTFLNDDNSIQRTDCLYVTHKGRKLVVPFASAYAYQVDVGERAFSALLYNATLVTSKRSAKDPSFFHAALGHVGQLRLRHANITIDGVNTSSLEHDPTSCIGRRLGNTGRNLIPHRRCSQTQDDRTSSKGFTQFGQQMDSDICTGFVPSFPHGFVGLLNFKDRWAAEAWLYFLRSLSATEVCSSLDHLYSTIKHRLEDGKIGRWMTDNGKPSLGEETKELADELVSERGFSVAWDSDTCA